MEQIESKDKSITTVLKKMDTKNKPGGPREVAELDHGHWLLLG